MHKKVFTVLSIAIIVSAMSLIATDNHFPVNQITSAASTSTSTVWSITWNRTYTASNIIEVDSVLQTLDSGYLLGGTSRGTSKIVIFKVDSSGNLLWNKTYDGVGNHLSKWLIPTNDGNYAIAGQYGGGFWLAKVDEDGNVLWNQTYIGNGFSWATSLTETSDGGYALVGQTGSSLGQIHSSSIDAMGVVWILKTDDFGVEQWNNTLGLGVVWSVVQKNDGGFAVAGTLTSDYLLMTTSSTGGLQWNKTYGSQDNDVCYSVVQTTDGGYALGGWMWLRSNGGGPNPTIVKTDALGNVEWTKYYSGGLARYMTKTGDGGFALVGTKLVKADASGNDQWETILQTTNSSAEGYSVTETQDGSYAVAGYGGNMNGWLAKITESTAYPSITPTPSPEKPSATPNESSTPSPTVPEFSFWIVLTLVAAATSSLAITRKHRKFSMKISH